VKWIAVDPPVLCYFIDTPPGRLVKTEDGRVLLIGEVCNETGEIGACGGSYCGAESARFVAYCDDLIWLIDAAKRKAGET
jgi:hypothetical protein